jgi:proteasome lid subunit RPN8/RPN11
MIKLDSRLAQRIKKHAVEAYPEECCGILLGISEGGAKIVSTILEISNARTNERRRRFLISADQYRQAEERARIEGWEILGIYHSHPDHPARPSEFDLAHALPSWSSLIVSVRKGIPEEFTSWLLKEDRSGYEEEQIAIET